MGDVCRFDFATYYCYNCGSSDATLERQKGLKELGRKEKKINVHVRGEMSKLEKTWRNKKSVYFGRWRHTLC